MVIQKNKRKGKEIQTASFCRSSTPFSQFCTIQELSHKDLHVSVRVPLLLTSFQEFIYLSITCISLRATGNKGPLF